ncbi:hypothetical protein AA106555_0302 [Neokomagataea thailandica NBRC 106555]|uniref:Oxalurate catabolism protein HpxZ n=2 Tax=Neokomagataea TaxID=1223423 RepID=A0A4Y6V9T0_9PROT|nr:MULTISPECIES: oxalurate catabolism protein HpxZ [Neokomagataea]QDH25440.1 oxalurate catabolism protein HpxZ [Neokomagataea tanensis]GBR50708.1 hypothetical protein AA106555_0302 [Neokomagataea thailandica NBRC 106555]
MPLNDETLTQELTELSDLYEKALNNNHLDILDALFLESEHTLRYGVGENLYGISEIRNFRKARTGGSPPRRIIKRAICILTPETATVNLEFQRAGESRLGRQSQTWLKTKKGWKIASAHVSLMADKS